MPYPTPTPKWLLKAIASKQEMASISNHPLFANRKLRRNPVPQAPKVKKRHA